MSNNAWAVSNELAKRMDGAPILGEYIYCQLSEKLDEMFFFNKEKLDAQQQAVVEKKDLVIGSGYIKKIVQFNEPHYINGESIMEYLKFACKNSN